jgi:hypothetical protein
MWDRRSRPPIRMGQAVVFRLTCVAQVFPPDMCGGSHAGWQAFPNPGSGLLVP